MHACFQSKNIVTDKFLAFPDPIRARLKYTMYPFRLNSKKFPIADLKSVLVHKKVMF